VNAGAGEVEREGLNLLRLENDALEALVLPEAGRVLELSDRATGRCHTVWLPMVLTGPRVERRGWDADGGGAAELGPDLLDLRWRVETGGDGLHLAAESDLLRAEKGLALEGRTLHGRLAFENLSGDLRRVEVNPCFYLLPAFGGDFPRPRTGVGHHRQRLYWGAPRLAVRGHLYRNFSGFDEVLGPGAWCAAVDLAEDAGVLASVRAPAAPPLLRLKAHRWFQVTWLVRPVLAPGERFEMSWRLAVLERGAPVAAAGERAIVFVEEGLGVPAGTKAVTLHIDPLGGGTAEARTERVEIDATRPGIVEMPVETGGETLHARIEVSDELARCAAGLPGPFAPRAAFCAGVPWSDAREALEALERDAAAAAAYAGNAGEYFSDEDIAAMRRLATGHDLSEACARAERALAVEPDLSRPRLRNYDAPETDPGATARAALDGALLWRAGIGGEALAARARARLGELARMWTRFGVLKHETIHHGVLLAAMVRAYDLLAREDGFAPNGRERIEAGLWDLADQIHAYQFGHSRSNWKGMEYAGLATFAVRFPAHPRAARFLREAESVYATLLSQGVLEGGLFWEMSLGYHQNVMAHLLVIAEALRRTGRDLLARRYAGRSLADMAQHLAGSILPSGMAPRFDDSSGGVGTAVLMSIARRLDDAPLAAAARFAGWRFGAGDLLIDAPIPREEARRPGSWASGPSGRAVLHRGTHALALDFGPHDCWHGDWDLLTFAIHDADGPVVPDAGTYRYEEALHWSHFKTREAHNVVTLEGREALKGCGELLAFDPVEPRLCVRGEPYPGVFHTRAVTAEGDTYVLEDRIEGLAPGERATWRANGLEPFAIEGTRARAGRLEVAWKADLTAEVAEIPVMPVGVRRIHDDPHATGWQLRLSRRAEESAVEFRVRVRISERK